MLSKHLKIQRKKQYTINTDLRRKLGKDTPSKITIPITKKTTLIHLIYLKCFSQIMLEMLNIKEPRKPGGKGRNKTTANKTAIRRILPDPIETPYCSNCFLY
jgi:hypothetical protein